MACIVAAAIGGAFFFGPNLLEAQGGLKYGLQVAALSTSIRVGSSGNIVGTGIESQIRDNRFWRIPGKFVMSLGVGGQWTSHRDSLSNKLSITGVFLEPRWVPSKGSDRIFPYVSGRLALLRQSSNFATASSGLGFGAGGGVVVPLGTVLNFDAGFAVVREQFGDFELKSVSGKSSFLPFTTYVAKIGLSWGFPRG